MKKKNLVLIFTLTILLTLSTGLMAQTSTPPSNYSTSTGSSADPYLISSLDNLYWLSQNTGEWDKYYKQTADIDASATSTWNPDGSGGYYGFSPIGNSTTNFTGSYDGQNYTISNLYIDRTTYLGLFGYIGEGSGTDIGNITNLNLVDVDISGSGIFLGGLSGYQDASSSVENVDVSGAINGGATTNNVGGLIGSASGSVTNCSFAGDVTGEFDSGGLIGDSYGSVTTSHSSGNVIADNNYAGGLIGRMTSGTVTESFSTSNLSKIAPNVYVFYVGGFVGGVIDGTVSQCYSTGNVLSFRDYVGGFAGENEGKINNCFSTGKVTRNGSTTLERFGGFVGWNERGEIINCYSTGAVEYDSGTNPTDKGFAGYINTGTGYAMTDNFWDTQTSGQTTTSGGATGKTTAEMKDYNTFTDQTTAGLTTAWDFVTNPNDDAANDDYWDDDQLGTVNSGYPILSWQSGADETLPVTLSVFTATYQNGYPTLRWSTQSENNNLGWNVYRSDSDDFNQAFKLNEQFIAGAGNSSIPTNYLYYDESLINFGDEYNYWIESISISNQSEFHGPISLLISEDDPEEETPEIIKEFVLYPNYPNPFNPSTTISFALPVSGNCELEIYDVKGRIVTTLFAGNVEAEKVNTYVWNGKDSQDKAVASGVYFYRLSGKDFVQNRKMILLK